MKNKINNNALAGEIKIEEAKKIQERINKNSNIIEGIVNKLVKEYCKDLDDYVKLIKEILDDKDNPPTDEELDDFTLNIPTLLYFTGEAQESLGIKEDIAKAIRLELYNNIYNEGNGTVADKTAKAELATQNEYIIHVAYHRAYLKIKLRMDLANELLQSVKKVISRRMVAYEVTKVDSGRIGNNG